MAGNRHIASALHNFLYSYTSRYSGFERYFLFGFIIADLDLLAIDLLGTEALYASGSPLGVTEFLARDNFSRRMRKVGVPLTQFRRARLTLHRSPLPIEGWAGELKCSGYALNFVTVAETIAGKTYQRTQSIFVAPHDPHRERRPGP